MINKSDLSQPANKKIKHQEKKAPITQRKGDGTQENYKNFCERCRLEYLTPTTSCKQCKLPTVPVKERIAKLKGLVEQFKQRRQKKKSRVEKWQKFQKTSKTLKSDRYTMQDYQRWEYFTDEEDSEEEIMKQAPAKRPTNPSFKAMEADLDKRAAKRREDYKKGDKKKRKGNDYFKRGKLELAEEEYNQGVEIDRNNKALWLNRALVRIKIGKFEEAEADCTSMLEYMEYLEDGYQRSYGFAVKAFLRRANARMMMDKFEEAEKDLLQLEEVIERSKKGKAEKGRVELKDMREEIEKRSRKAQIKAKVEQGLENVISKHICIYLLYNTVFE